MTCHRTRVWKTPLGTFIGAKAAAKAHGCSVHAVYAMISLNGNLDTLGIGKSRPGNCSKGKSVQIGPHTFRSQKDLGVAVGMSENQVSRRLRSGRMDDIIAALMAADLRRAA